MLAWQGLIDPRTQSEKEHDFDVEEFIVLVLVSALSLLAADGAALGHWSPRGLGLVGLSDPMIAASSLVGRS
jgi:hypothetical protein